MTTENKGSKKDIKFGASFVNIYQSKINKKAFPKRKKNEVEQWDEIQRCFLLCLCLFLGAEHLGTCQSETEIGQVEKTNVFWALFFYQSPGENGFWVEVFFVCDILLGKTEFPPSIQMA